jgi:hypothetical protein
MTTTPLMPERIELVENHVHDGRLRALGRLDHGRLHGLELFERLRVAVEQLEQQVSPQCLHSFPPSPFFRSPAKFCEHVYLNVGPMFLACKEKMASPGKNGLSDGS